MDDDQNKNIHFFCLIFQPILLTVIQQISPLHLYYNFYMTRLNSKYHQHNQKIQYPLKYQEKNDQPAEDHVLKISEQCRRNLPSEQMGNLVEYNRQNHNKSCPQKTNMLIMVIFQSFLNGIAMANQNLLAAGSLSLHGNILIVIQH